MYQKDNILLHPLEKKDISKEYQKWFYDQEVTKFNSHGLFPNTIEQIEEYIKSLKNSTSIIVWAIFDVFDSSYLDNIHIGNVSLQEIDWINRSAEFAIIIGEKNYWGKGIASKVLQLVLEHAFLKLGLNRVYAGTSELNIGMQKVFTKNNFKLEGIKRKAQFLLGDFHDIFTYSILKNEYKKE